MEAAKNIAVLGSTGSIGASTLEVVAASGGRLKIAALAARNSTQILLEQARQFRPRWIVVSDAEAAQRQDWSTLPTETELLVGAGIACSSGSGTGDRHAWLQRLLGPLDCKAPGQR